MNYERWNVFGVKKINIVQYDIRNLINKRCGYYDKKSFGEFFDLFE